MQPIQEIILLKEGEMALKGLNRSQFEETMLKNIKRRLKPLGEFRYVRAQSTVVIEPQTPCDMDEVKRRLDTVFGIVSYSRAAATEKEMSAIRETCVSYLSEALRGAKTFKVNAKRSDKRFPLTSPEICAEIGHTILEAFSHLQVDVHHPDIIVTVEIRDRFAYIHGGRCAGAGGIPVGTGGDGMLLISGGIDSPVAGWMMAKRGMRCHAVHFVSPPYTSERALQKVKTLLSIVAKWAGEIPLHVVYFTEIQEAIRDHLPQELFTVLMRRMMMRIAQDICAEQNRGGYGNLQALITGESLGQVASQTLAAMVCTDAVCHMPVLRPQIGMDKNEIVDIARKIGTFETSILPYEDCCTVFTPKHPKTKPQLAAVEAAERSFDFAPLLLRAKESSTFSLIRPDWLI